MAKIVLILMILNILPTSYCEDFSNDVFGDNKLCCPAAFGQFNSDKLTDVFIIEKSINDMNEISVLTSNNNPPLLRPSKAVCKFKDKVVSLVPADFDGDGAIDSLVVLNDEDSMYKGFILWGNSTGWKCPTEKDFSIKFKSQPLLLDYNGDMIADLFGENEKLEKVFWIFNAQRTFPEVINMDGNSTSVLSSFGGHAFIDVDGDLAADLWLVTNKHFELWKSNLNFKEFQIIEFPKNVKIIGQSTFLDIDLDGNIELLLPICKTNSLCSFYVYEFDANKWYDLQVTFKDDKDMTWIFKNDSPYLYTDTVTARAGDYNFDGYPDILITMFNKLNNPKVVFLQNEPCTVSCAYSRTYIPKWNLFDGFHISVMGTFFDFNQDGALDIFLVNVSSDGKNYSVGAFKNPLEFDATFIKVIVLTGNCYHNCSFDQKLHGTNQPGPSMIYSITTTEGQLQKSCATQMSQSSHSALQLPFITLGLGRSWNFVDNLKLGLPMLRTSLGNNTSMTESRSRLLQTTFTQIIPNSQLVVIPYPIGSPDRWIHKLFITPSKAMLLTAGALTATCFFVAAIIALLHLFERKEDRKERLQESQRFHFVAM